MGENSAAGLSLFDLLARDWALKGEVAQVVFNHDDTAVAFRLVGGALALGSLKDAESPKMRTRIEADTGRNTIRPRENPVAPLKTPKIALQSGLPVIRFGTQGFAAIDADGALQQVTAGGQVLVKLKPAEGVVTSLCSDLSGEIIVIARQAELTLYGAGMSVLAEIALDHVVTCLAIASDGKTLAAWGEGTLSLIDVANPSTAPQAIACNGEITEISWQKSGQHLSCASADKSFYIINRAEGTAQRVEDFPSPVRNTAFSETGKALVTSGAFRLVSWDSNDLPQNDEPGTPLTTGKAGFVVINAIAAHPKRSLVATGYANGLLAIASIGKAEEMMLHQEKDAEVSSLCWSKTGEHLAIGYSSGKAAIVTFPDQMFK